MRMEKECVPPLQQIRFSFKAALLPCVLVMLSSAVRADTPIPCSPTPPPPEDAHFCSEPFAADAPSFCAASKGSCSEPGDDWSDKLTGNWFSPAVEHALSSASCERRSNTLTQVGQSENSDSLTDYPEYSSDVTLTEKRPLSRNTPECAGRRAPASATLALQDRIRPARRTVSNAWG